MRRIAATATTGVCVLVLLVTVLAILVPALLGLQRYVITGGSMTGAIPKGAVIYSKLTPVDRLRVGDIITFHPPERSSPVTHRIAAIEPGRDGSRTFQTKGDHNGAMDPWKMTLNEPMQARYVLHVPYLGYLLGALAIRDVRLVVISLPATLIALTLLWSLWRKPQVDLGWAEDDDVAACDGMSTKWGGDT